MLVILGTRPEAIKLAPVIRALRARGVSCRVAVTAQHRAMLDQMLAAFRLRPADDLDLMRPDQDLGAFAKRAFSGLLEVTRRVRPALVVVQGDTTTALCGALAACHEGVPVAHVEAGLRTFDLSNPFPEEANRVVIDDLSRLLFAPTTEAARNLAGARRRARVLVTGNTVIDAARWAAAHPRPIKSVALASLLRGGAEQLILVTMHRRESFDGGLARACAAMREVLERRPRAKIVFPVHLNPRVRRVIGRELRHSRARLLGPLDYFDFIAALEACRFVMTDSGGVQEEAASLGKPVIVLRRTTDRPEAVRAGVAVVAGFDRRAIVARALTLLDDEKAYRRMARRVDVFGDGKAAERVASGIARFLKDVRAPNRGP